MDDIVQLKGHEPKLYKTVNNVVGLFLIIYYVNMIGPMKNKRIKH